MRKYVYIRPFEACGNRKVSESLSFFFCHPVDVFKSRDFNILCIAIFKGKIFIHVTNIFESPSKSEKLKRWNRSNSKFYHQPYTSYFFLWILQISLRLFLDIVIWILFGLISFLWIEIIQTNIIDLIKRKIIPDSI